MRSCSCPVGKKPRKSRTTTRNKPGLQHNAYLAETLTSSTGALAVGEYAGLHRSFTCTFNLVYYSVFRLAASRVSRRTSTILAAAFNPAAAAINGIQFGRNLYTLGFPYKWRYAGEGVHVQGTLGGERGRACILRCGHLLRVLWWCVKKMHIDPEIKVITIVSCCFARLYTFPGPGF